MAEQGLHKINSLRQRWIAMQLLGDAVLALSIAALLDLALFVVDTFKYFTLLSHYQFAGLIGICFLVIIIIRRPWQLSPSSVAGFLNQTYPRLEESAELVIKAPNELSLLQKLQLSKVETALTDVPGLPKAFFKRLKFAAICFAVFFIINLIVYLCGVAIVKVTGDNILFPQNKTVTEQVLPQISSVDVTITPPSYTGKPARHQDKFTILAEEGSTAKWQINTNVAVKQVSLLFNDHEKITLKPKPGKTQWITGRTIDKPGFYQVNVDGKLSDLYQIETIKDAPPQVRIKTPKQYTYIDAGEAPRVTLTTTITDDYGVSNAMVYATVAKGSGEGVKFKEYKINFNQVFQGSKEYNLSHLFDLPKLNMEPGDELYFYVEATDNHQQKMRTDVHTVTIQDTAALMSMDGIVNGSNLKPEYFRSQRQIIMDTEKLLKDKDTISKESFNTLSANIGVDQKMLRLRYGKFLGEEDESSVGHEENSELSKVENFNNATMILDSYTDKHDNAEDATFLEPAIKAQLKATLTEMWNAELHLRMYKPQDALPYEYKALRLLKDLQQKSRSYVAKTAYKPMPLKPEKRLSGDLDKILQPTNQQEIKQVVDQFETLKNAVQVLEHIKQNRIYSTTDKHTLQLAKQQLSLKASAQPGIYLTAVSAMNRILNAERPTMQDVELVERAIQKTLPQSARVPQNAQAGPDMGLSQLYYQNLKRNR